LNQPPGRRPTTLANCGCTTSREFRIPAKRIERSVPFLRAEKAMFDSGLARFDGVDLFLFDPHTSIDIDDDGLKRLADKIKKQSKHNDVVYIRADETVPFGAFCTVIDSLRQSGISNISIVTQPINDRSRTN
jgi:biopolymer transport protein ExbD/biopolymer transport protein TolR